MQTVILCGGLGTRMGLATKNTPKPLIPIGDNPVLWHIMKIYQSQGFNDFILCLGQKGEKIREYFEKNKNDDWTVQLVDTGENASKADRIKKVRNLIRGDNFFLAYGDDVSDVDLNKLLKFHEYMGLTATITAVQLTSPFGIVEMNEDNVITQFKEKPVIDKWINGGFMVLNKKIFKHLGAGELENEVFEKLVKLKQICAYKHKGYWMCMNTLKEQMELESIWNNGKAFWKMW